MKVNIIIGRTPTHLIKTVKCNGTEFEVPFPIANQNFIEIVESITIKSQLQSCLAVLSKKQNYLNSIQQFYKVQEQCQHHFNVPIEIDSLNFALYVLSQAEAALKQLDKLKFSDLLSVFKHGFDSFASKMHSKLDRRIHKYLAETQRNSFEKEQIQKMMLIIKASSTDEDIGEQKQQKSQKVVEKQPIKIKKVEQAPKQLQKQFLSEQDKCQKSPQKEEKTSKHHKKHEGHHHNHKKSQDIEADWEDVDDQKLNKKAEKRLKKKQILQQAGREQNQKGIPSGEQGEQAKKRARKKSKNLDETKEKLLFSNYKEKPERDMKVQLGITGDTEDGWRQRYRM